MALSSASRPGMREWALADPRFEGIEAGPVLWVWDSVLAQVKEHAQSDLRNEVAGFLLGYSFKYADRDTLVICIDTAVKAHHVKATPTRVELTHESWAAFTAECDEKFPEKQRVGWYHSHPNLGIFLSNDDLFVHAFFDKPHQVALVIDPVRQQCGFFKRVHGKLDPRRYYGFTEFLSSAPSAVSPSANLRLQTAAEPHMPPPAQHVVPIRRPKPVLLCSGMGLGALACVAFGIAFLQMPEVPVLAAVGILGLAIMCVMLAVVGWKTDASLAGSQPTVDISEDLAKKLERRVTEHVDKVSRETTGEFGVALGRLAERFDNAMKQLNANQERDHRQLGDLLKGGRIRQLDDPRR